MTNAKTKILLLVLVLTLAVSRCIFLIPSPITNSSWLDIQMNINGSTYAFDVKHSFVDPILWTLLITLCTAWVLRSPKPVSDDKISIAGQLKILAGIVFCFMLASLLYWLNPGTAFGKILIFGTYLEKILLGLALICLLWWIFWSTYHGIRHMVSPRR